MIFNFNTNFGNPYIPPPFLPFKLFKFIIIIKFFIRLK